MALLHVTSRRAAVKADWVPAEIRRMSPAERLRSILEQRQLRPCSTYYSEDQPVVCFTEGDEAYLAELVVSADLNGQSRFYRHVLGLPQVHADDRYVWFDMGWPNMLEILAVTPDDRRYGAPRVQVSFAVGDVVNVHATLVQRGAEPVGGMMGGPEFGTMGAYFLDAESNFFAITQRFGPPYPMHQSPIAREAIVGWPVWIGVAARDLDAQRGFYRDVPGLPEIRRETAWSWFDMGWPHLLEVVSVQPHRPELSRPGYRLGFGVGDIRHAHDELVRRGAEAIGGIEGGPEFAGYWASFCDPEGNVLEVTQPLGPPFPS